MNVANYFLDQRLSRLLATGENAGRVDCINMIDIKRFGLQQSTSRNHKSGDYFILCISASNCERRIVNGTVSIAEPRYLVS